MPARHQHQGPAVSVRGLSYVDHCQVERSMLRQLNPPSNGRMNEEIFDTLDDARRKLALWRYDYNNVRPHSSPGNQTPAEARRALEQFEGSAHAALAQTDDQDYEIETRRLSLLMRELRGAGHSECRFLKEINNTPDIPIFKIFRTYALTKKKSLGKKCSNIPYAIRNIRCDICLVFDTFRKVIEHFWTAKAHPLLIAPEIEACLIRGAIKYVLVK